MSAIRLTRIEGRYTYAGKAATYGIWSEKMGWGTEWTMRVEYVSGAVDYRYASTLKSVRDIIEQTEAVAA